MSNCRKLCTRATDNVSVWSNSLSFSGHDWPLFKREKALVQKTVLLRCKSARRVNCAVLSSNLQQHLGCDGSNDILLQVDNSRVRPILRLSTRPTLFIHFKYCLSVGLPKVAIYICATIFIYKDKRTLYMSCYLHLFFLLFFLVELFSYNCWVRDVLASRTAIFNNYLSSRPINWCMQTRAKLRILTTWVVIVSTIQYSHRFASPS